MEGNVKLEVKTIKQQDKFYWTVSEREPDEYIDQFYALSKGGYNVKSRAFHAGLSWCKLQGFKDVKVNLDLKGANNDTNI